MISLLRIFVATFLLEVGTEELPADFARLVLPQLEKKVRNDFAEKHLRHGLISCNSTPRRIVLRVENLVETTEVLQQEYKGPPASQAFKNGVATQAAKGFARRFGLEPDSLEIKETHKGEFVFATVQALGEPTYQILSELIPQWIGGLQGRRFMRWGSGEKRFSRPVRWLLALLDDSLIPVTVLGTDPVIKSDFLSKGHRLYSNELKIPSATQYSSILAQAGVQIERDERLSSIRSLVNKASNELNAFPDASDELLEELTDLVESPSLIVGGFEDSYLDLPAEVLGTVMRIHQRYIPLYLENSNSDPLALNAVNILSSKFLCISNGLVSAKDNIRIGNERVLKARLADAEFFVKTDLSLKSSIRCNQLKSVTFSKDLGSLFDRVRRIEWLADLFSSELGLPDKEKKYISKAAYYSKNDLVSQMVGEFPELQGVMGGKYLLAEGEPREVALAVLEHYFPRGAGDQLPESIGGSVLSLADKFELLLSIFSKGERPSGSSDPYALRRAANGIIQIAWHNNWHLDLNTLLSKSINHWKKILPNLEIDISSLINDLSEFFRQRLISLLEEDGIDIDLVSAVAGDSIPAQSLLENPTDARLRADLLVKMRKNGKLLAVQAVVTRAARLADKGDLPKTVLSASNVINSELFEKDSEFQMLKVITTLESITNASMPDKYLCLAEALAAGSQALASFFDGETSVMVMTERLDVRVNRLNLLGVLRNQALVLADFSQISG